MSRQRIAVTMREGDTPADGEQGASRVVSVFEKQQANRWRVASTSAKERAGKLLKLKEAIVAQTDGLFDALQSDLHKSRAEVALTELQPALGEINHTVKHLKKWMKPVRVGTPFLLAGTSSEVRYEPKGVVLILAPWNYPFGLLVNPLVAAIAAGNCAVLKPSEKAPATSHFLAGLIAGVFDESEVALFEGDPAVAEELLALPFDHIFYTGSTRVGRIVMPPASPLIPAS